MGDPLQYPILDFIDTCKYHPMSVRNLCFKPMQVNLHNSAVYLIATLRETSNVCKENFKVATW
jgi:hypothetical protein